MMDEEPTEVGIVAPAASTDDRAYEAALRPRTLEEVVGQDRVREQLALVLEAAVARGSVPDHVLLSGPPGLGKTTLAMSIAHYMAMEDFRVDVIVGKGPGATAIPLEIPPFTVVGATTRAGLLPGPLRDRFGFTAQLDYYEPDHLQQIVTRSAGLLRLDLTVDGAAEIAGRSRGTPRIANRLLRRVRDYAEVRTGGVLDLEAARTALALYEVDDLGLDRLDVGVLRALCVSFGGGPVGVSTLAVAVGEERETVEEIAEPYLVRLGFLARTPRGRVATPAAWRHLGLAPPVGAAAQLPMFEDPSDDASAAGS